jgi:Tir chaperone protein (CesT) family
MIKEQISAVMAELGPLMELAIVTEFPDANTWQLGIDEDTVVYAELNEDRAMLTLNSEVGAMSPSVDAPKLCRLLLQYNAHAGIGDGLVLGLDIEDIVTQTMLIPAAGLDRSALSAAMADFLQRLEGWRIVLRNTGAAVSDERPDGTTEYLRV